MGTLVMPQSAESTPVPPPQKLAELTRGPLIPRAHQICAFIQWSAVVLGLTIGLSNFLVWFLGPNFLPGMPNFTVMRVNMALGLIAASISLTLWSGSRPPVWRARLAQVSAMLAVLIGGLTGLQDIMGVNFGIDQLLRPGTFEGDGANRFTVNPGRMSLNAAVSLFFLGLALVGLDWRIKVAGRFYAPASALALVATLPAILGLVGYTLGVPAFTGLLRSTNILLHTSVVLVSLSLGVLAARPERPPVRRVLSTGADGVLLRWTLPGTLGLLLMLGWLIGRGRQGGLLESGEGSALMLYGGLVLLSALLVAASQAVSRQEASARQAASALMEGEERNRAILHTALDAVLVMDAAGLITAWNPAAERIFGWESSEVLGTPLAQRIIPDRLRKVHEAGLSRLLATGESKVLGRRLQLPALRRDGSEISVELSINALPGRQQMLFVGFIRDVTEQLAAEVNLRNAKEAAEAASRAKDHFLAALSHELRTPLAPVLLCTTALRSDDRLPLDVREQLGMMERNIALEARLIDDLLDITRITRGKLPVRKELCDVNTLLTHAVEFVSSDARGRRIDTRLHLGARLSGFVGDPARLQQVFWNLLTNAVKFTPAEGRIEVSTQDGDDGRLFIQVRDSGLGFAPQAAENIFQPFEQAGREGDHRFGGLGLGLAIARAIVDLHEGKIRALSAGEGQGATFIVELPNAMEPPAGFRSTADDPATTPVPGRSLRLLVVDDHEATLSVLTRLLTRAGYGVVSAVDLTSAVAAASENEIDVVVSDLGLPDGSGHELMMRLRARQPHLRGIALTGYGMEEDFQRSRDAGYAAHLVKPVNFAELCQALQTLAAELAASKRA